MMNADDRARFAAAADVSRETLDRLAVYVEALGRWNPSINLVAPTSLRWVWTRHLLDSAQLLSLAPKPAARWADLGCGGGLPGLVVAAIAAEQRPWLRVTLVDSDARKIAFVREAARLMGLAVDIQQSRLERPPPIRYEVVSARALAPLPRLFPLIEPWLAVDGVALLPKGKRVADELTAVRPYWHSAIVTTPSLADETGVILTVSGLCRVSER